MTARLTWPRYLAYWLVGLVATALIGLLCVHIGANVNGVSWGWPAPAILQYRLVRVGSAALVGAALAASGVLLQALLRNPLADPYVLGISTGSSVFVLIWLIFGGLVLTAVEAHHLPAWCAALFTYGELIPAILGALLTCVIVFAVAKASSSAGIDPLAMLLVGVVVSAFNGALIVLLNALAPQGVRANIMSFLIGYISDGTPPIVVYLALLVLLLGWLPALFAAPAMNIASLSDVEAGALGVRLSLLRTMLFIAASVMTAASIALARSIAFVGLICPHVCRMLFGPDHRQLIVTSPFCGAIFLMLADALVQILRGVFPGDLPVGVITALAGGPFFLVLLRRRRGAVE
jgi:iron complex transport system permease protein